MITNKTDNVPSEPVSEINQSITNSSNLSRKKMVFAGIVASVACILLIISISANAFFRNVEKTDSQPFLQTENATDDGYLTVDISDILGMKKTALGQPLQNTGNLEDIFGRLPVEQLDDSNYQYVGRVPDVGTPAATLRVLADAKGITRIEFSSRDTFSSGALLENIEQKKGPDCTLCWWYQDSLAYLYPNHSSDETLPLYTERTEDGALIGRFGGFIITLIALQNQQDMNDFYNELTIAPDGSSRNSIYRSIRAEQRQKNQSEANSIFTPRMTLEQEITDGVGKYSLLLENLSSKADVYDFRIHLFGVSQSKSEEALVEKVEISNTSFLVSLMSDGFWKATYMSPYECDTYFLSEHISADSIRITCHFSVTDDLRNFDSLESVVSSEVMPLPEYYLETVKNAPVTFPL